MTIEELTQLTHTQLVKRAFDDYQRIEKLEHELAWLKRQLFGSKSERFIPNDLQTALELDVCEQSPVEVTKTPVSYERTEVKKVAGHCRGTMPSHLPIKEETIKPQEDVSGCDHIGDEISWEFEYEPGSLFVKKYIRPKFVRRDGNGIAIGILPSRPIEKGNFGAGFIARTLIDKFVYHIPFDRQRRKYKSENQVDFPESTLCDVARQVCEKWIVPLYEVAKRDLLQCTYLMADETPIPVLVKDNKGKTHRGYLWVYYDPVKKLVIFDYRCSRNRTGPNDFLKSFRGTLQVDGYEGYAEVLDRPGMIVAGCMAHVRRYFEQALDSDKECAEYAMNEISSWFSVEKQSAEQKLSFDERLKQRQEVIAPSMARFELWMKEQVASGKILPKSPIGKAIAYALNMWPRFAAFNTDGRIELSNNLIENVIRRVALGRKNWLFAGSHDSAQRSAIFYSLSASAQIHNVDPFEYFKDLLTRIPDYPQSKLTDLLPANWRKVS